MVHLRAVGRSCSSPPNTHTLLVLCWQPSVFLVQQERHLTSAFTFAGRPPRMRASVPTFSFSQGHGSDWIRACPKLGHLNSLHVQQTCAQTRSQSEALEVRLQHIHLADGKIQPITQGLREQGSVMLFYLWHQAKNWHKAGVNKCSLINSYIQMGIIQYMATHRHIFFTFKTFFSEFPAWISS